MSGRFSPLCRSADRLPQPAEGRLSALAAGPRPAGFNYCERPERKRKNPPQRETAPRRLGRAHQSVRAQSPPKRPVRSLLLALAANHYPLIVLLAAGVIAGIGGLLIKRVRGSDAGEISEALWLGGGRLSFWRSQARGVLSIVIVGMGAALGREGAPQLTGGSHGPLRIGEATDLAAPAPGCMRCGSRGGRRVKRPSWWGTVCGPGPARHPVAACRAAGGGDERYRDRGNLGCGSRPGALPGSGLRCERLAGRMGAGRRHRRGRMGPCDRCGQQTQAAATGSGARADHDLHRARRRIDRVPQLLGNQKTWSAVLPQLSAQTSTADRV